MLVGRAFIRRHGRILLVQRSLDDRNNPGLWEVPGGKVDQGELLLESLMREVKEEAGLNIRPISPTLMGESYYFSNEGRYAGMLYLPLYTVFETEGEALLSFEHCNLQWLTWEEATSRSDLTPATAHMLTVMEPWLRG